MRILIENDETLEYLMDESHWSKDPLKGRQFNNRRQALRAAKLEPVGRFNIVWYIPETKQFVNLDHGHGVPKLEKAEGL
jgi:hypothetical protein